MRQTRNKISSRQPAVRASAAWAWAAAPLSRWQQHFDAWRLKIGDFRRWEKNVFLPARNRAALRRAHLGWVCELIAEGQRLAVELTNGGRRRQTQLKHLDNFIDNLRTTFLVWHAPETINPKQNPLAKYFD
jgi:hypothetical protein